MESAVSAPVLTVDAVMQRIHKLGLVRVTAVHLESIGIVPDGDRWVKTLLARRHLRALPPEEVANSGLERAYDVVQADGKVVAQKDAKRGAESSGGKRQPKVPTVRPPVPPLQEKQFVDHKWIDFCFHHPSWCFWPKAYDLYLFAEGKDVDYTDFHRVMIEQFQVKNAWFFTRTHLSRKLGYIHPSCKSTRFHPLADIRWCQEVVPQECKARLAKLQQEYATQPKGG